MTFRIIFMNTPDFAVPSLEMLVEEGYEVVAVVTQPDKPKGRGHMVCSPPVKEFALQHGIKVLQPEKVKTEEFVDQLKEFSPNLFITAAYGRILTQAVLDVPAHGCINVHASLLPKYRGAAPINHAVINGEKVTGVTTMLTNIGMDTGDILLKEELEIPEDMTAGEAYVKLAKIGAKVLKDTLLGIQKGTLKATPQDDIEATHASMMGKESGRIDWTKSASDIHNLVRGTNPWPIAFAVLNRERLKIWKTKVVSAEGHEESPGKILEVCKDSLKIAAGVGVVEVFEVQPDSGKRMTAGEYARGHKVVKGDYFSTD